MAYSTPKTNWTTSDGIKDSDLNRIENNNKANHDDLYSGCNNYKNGFEFTALNTAITLYPGNALAYNGGYFISLGVPFYKVFNSTKWAAGSGAGVPCILDNVTYALNTWYFIFIVKNPSTGVVDIVADSSINGSNIATSEAGVTYGFTEFIRIGYLKSSTLWYTHGVGSRFWLGGATANRTHSFSLTSGQGQVATQLTAVDANTSKVVPLGLRCNVGSVWSISIPTDTGIVWSYRLGSQYSTGETVKDTGKAQYSLDVNGQYYYYHNQAVTTTVNISQYITYFDEIGIYT